MTFPSVAKIEWLDRGGPPAKDASGTHDCGNIDTFVVDESGHELAGGTGDTSASSHHRRGSSCSLSDRCCLARQGPRSQRMCDGREHARIRDGSVTAAPRAYSLSLIFAVLGRVLALEAAGLGQQIKRVAQAAV